MVTENEKKKRKPRIGIRKKREMDEKVEKSIAHTQEVLRDSLEPVTIQGLNGYQRKQVHQYFEKTQEYRVKTYREKDDVVMKVYPVGKLRRVAEQKTQEVLMKGKAEVLPPMGSFERFVIHDYLKDREGIKTESYGEEGKDRHVEIHPLFGRSLKKAKRRLTR